MAAAMEAKATRRSGLLIPLFSCVSSRSWGIGDIGDLPAVTAWLGAAGQRVLQLLPLNEMAPGQQSPYSAITAMAIDPIYIDLAAVPDFQALGGEAALDAGDRDELQRVRASTRIDYAAARRLKQKASRAAFTRFIDSEWRHDSERAAAFRAYIAEQAWWLDDYALFRALHTTFDERAWMDWPAPWRDRDAAALDQARQEHAERILRTQYRQWLADIQWRAARQAAAAVGVSLFGDLPFMVDGDSADVWAHREWFILDASVGVPPDAFSATGQDWGMPVYRWDAIERSGFAWLRNRARRSAQLFDGYRVDHLVGFYRTYGRPRAGGEPFFTPADEPAQRALGETVLGIFREPGSGTREVIDYDRFILATGSQLFRPPVPGLAEFAFDMDQYDSAQTLDAHLKALPNNPEAAARNTVVVAGGGLTGLEAATEMPIRLRAALGQDARFRVILIDTADLPGGSMGVAPQPSFAEALSHAGVEVRTAARVTAIDAGGVTLSSGERIETNTVVWTAGMRAHALAAQVPGQHDAIGRVVSDAFLRAPAANGIFVTGDTAHVATDDIGNVAAMSCQHALSLGRVAGHNAAAELVGLPLHPYSQPKYVTCVDLGAWGALFTVGWDRKVQLTRQEAKAVKQEINRVWIYPPAADREAVFAVANPDYVIVP